MVDANGLNNLKERINIIKLKLKQLSMQLEKQYQNKIKILLALNYLIIHSYQKYILLLKRLILYLTRH